MCTPSIKFLMLLKVLATFGLVMVAVVEPEVVVVVVVVEVEEEEEEDDVVIGSPLVLPLTLLLLLLLLALLLLPLTMLCSTRLSLSTNKELGAVEEEVEESLRRNRLASWSEGS